MREPSSLRGIIEKRIHKLHIFHNFSLKVFSLVFACVLWVFVTSYHDPEVALTFSNVSVKLIHTDSLENEGKVITVLDNTDVIPIVTVNANRSVVESLGQDNIIATADINSMTADGKVPITLTTNKAVDSISGITGSASFVEVSVEDRATMKFTLNATTVGEVEEGYVLGNISMEQNQVRVSGPASVVSRISKAGVVIDVSDSTANISTNADIHLYDEEGVDIVIGKNLSMNIDKIAVSVDVLPTKEVPLTLTIAGVPADGYEISGENSISPSSVLIAAKRSVLDKIESINIPSSAIDLSGADDNVVKEVDIRNYLPDGVRLVDGDKDFTINITIGIAKKTVAETNSEP